MPTYGDIELSHEIEVGLPAEIFLRGSDRSIIKEVKGNRIYIDPPPKHAVGAGQAVNIRSQSLKIKGFFTEEDEAYIEAAKELGVHRYFLSFVHENNDLLLMRQRDPQAEMGLKIEDGNGLDFVTREFAPDNSTRLIAARDDYFINLDDKLAIFDALELIIERDPNAILASRLLTSLEENETVALQDLSDLHLVYQMGYRSFLLSDNLCLNGRGIEKAASILSEYLERFGEKVSYENSSESASHNWLGFWRRRKGD